MTTVTSKLDIWNLAVTRIGHEPISEEGENTKAGRLCRLHYPLVLDACLRAHPWNFAVRRAELAALTTVPGFEFTAAFALPTDPYCLKVIRTSHEANGFSSTAIYGYPGIHGYGAMPVEYRVETIRHEGTDVRCILINDSSLSIEYIARVTDVAQFDALFVDVLAARLAAEIAIALTDNKSASESALQVYQMKLAEARTVDAQEGSPRDIINVDGWLMARI